MFVFFADIASKQWIKSVWTCRFSLEQFFAAWNLTRAEAAARIGRHHRPKVSKRAKRWYWSLQDTERSYVVRMTA